MEVVLDGALAAPFLRVPHVLHYRGNTLDRPTLVFDVLTRFWTATSDHVFCISSATAEIFRKRGLAAKVEVLYDPVDVERFARASRSETVRAELGAGPDDFLVGTVARIHPRKGIATFLRAGALAMESVPNLRLVIVGCAEAKEEVPYHGEMLALVSSLGIAERVVWAGARPDIPQVMKALDAFVMCSRHEGFGIVVAEAMAAGLPMVLTEEGAFPELALLGSDMRLADPGIPGGYAEEILRLAGNVGKGKAGQRHTISPAEHFGMKTLASRVAAVYELLLKSREGS